jgi:hypothetical protein
LLVAAVVELAGMRVLVVVELEAIVLQFLVSLLVVEQVLNLLLLSHLAQLTQ